MAGWKSGGCERSGWRGWLSHTENFKGPWKKKEKSKNMVLTCELLYCNRSSTIPSGWRLVYCGSSWPVEWMTAHFRRQKPACDWWRVVPTESSRGQMTQWRSVTQNRGQKPHVLHRRCEINFLQDCLPDRFQTQQNPRFHLEHTDDKNTHVAIFTLNRDADSPGSCINFFSRVCKKLL